MGKRKAKGGRKAQAKEGRRQARIEITAGVVKHDANLPPVVLASDREIYNGQARADLVRESDPGGRPTEHLVRRDAAVIDRMLQLGKLAKTDHEAGDRFRKDYEKAGLPGHYGVLDWERTRGKGSADYGDDIAAAVWSIRLALHALGTPGSLMRLAAIYVLGEQMTLADAVTAIRFQGRDVNEPKVSGILHAVLERLALHYGIVKQSELQGRAAVKGQASGYSAAGERARIYAAAERAKAKQLREEAEAGEVVAIVRGKERRTKLTAAELYGRLELAGRHEYAAQLLDNFALALIRTAQNKTVELSP